jgi:acetyl-CoA carboxylase carboxyltransferase component
MTDTVGSAAAPTVDLSPEGRRAWMSGLLDQVLDMQETLLDGGGERYAQRHRDRGKLMVRDRIALLLDAGSPFLELCALAGAETDDPLGGGIVAGIGTVHGTECLVLANDPTVRGGTLNPTGITKVLRCYDIALTNRLPFVNLVESGGADLPHQADIFNRGGAQFRHLAELSAAGIPTIAVVTGPSTAGGAYVPGMSEYTIFVAGRARVYLGGPPLVKMAIDEDADDEQLGGAEMHARVSGLADSLAGDEIEALAKVRSLVRRLNWRKQGPVPASPVRPPLVDPERLMETVTPDLKAPFDMRDVIAPIVDGSEFEEFKPLYGPMLVAGFATLHGHEVGILANNGILFSPEAQKAAQFVQLCNRRDLPILFLHNINGFMVGTEYERGGIIKDGAALITVISTSTVPHLVVMVGASYGAGNYAMSGRGYKPRFVFSWPSHRIAVMGGKQLAGVMSIVRRKSAEDAGRPFSEEADAAMRTEIEDQIDRESTALYATGQVWDDGIIDPRDTRTVLGLALSACTSAPVRGTRAFGVIRL